MSSLVAPVFTASTGKQVAAGGGGGGGGGGVRLTYLFASALTQKFYG